MSSATDAKYTRDKLNVVDRSKAYDNDSQIIDSLFAFEWLNWLIGIEVYKKVIRRGGQVTRNSENKWFSVR